MNWIDFKERIPKAEPDRTIWVRFEDGREVLSLSHLIPESITHWAEIEPPVKNAPPTPDPFEEWFRTVGVFIFDNPNGKYALARAAYDKGWDAAIRWKEGK